MKTLNSYNFKNKVVLVRSDINSDVKNGKPIMSERIRESAITIKELQKKGAKVVVLAHQGRKGKYDFISLKGHCNLLNKFCKIKFVEDTIGGKSEKAISNLKSGEAILLENVRFLEEEMENKKNALTKFFIGKIDFYVNDAFSVCHRKQNSITVFPKYFKSCMGRVLEREVNALKKVNLKNCLYILGGVKPADNIKLLKDGRKVIATGFFGQLCLYAKGQKFGEYENFLKDSLGDEFNVYKKLRAKQKNVITPVDYAVKVSGKRKEIDLDEFPNDKIIYDIGSKTIKIFEEEIRKAKAVYIKGPSGDCRYKEFSKGTFAVLKAVSQNKGFTLIGGGQTNEAIDKLGISRKKFSHISLSGGALLRYLSGEKLPGLEVLN